MVVVQEEALEAFERKLVTIFTDSFTATTKNKRTELDKKLEKLVKDTGKAFKKVRC